MKIPHCDTELCQREEGLNIFKNFNSFNVLSLVVNIFSLSNKRPWREGIGKNVTLIISLNYFMLKHSRSPVRGSENSELRQLFLLDGECVSRAFHRFLCKYLSKNMCSSYAYISDAGKLGLFDQFRLRVRKSRWKMWIIRCFIEDEEIQFIKFESFFNSREMWSD